MNMESELRDRLQASLGTDVIVGRELGGGGMSRVFLANDTALGRQVVVKVLPSEMGETVNLERFKQEIRLAARLQHPHIVPLLSAGQVDGLPYFTMPYIDGESLRARLTRDGELPIFEAVRILREVATALGYAHGEGLVHRDVKPDNVLLSGGIAMVTDFGIAKALLDARRTPVSGASPLTAIGTVVGTPAYIAPEQAAGDSQIDQRADIYAWGAMAYEVLTGSPPFAGRSAQATLAAHVSEPPEQILRRRPRVPPVLADLVMKSLEKRPSDRPQSAEELVRTLDALTAPGARPGRRLIALGGIGAAVLALVAIFGRPAMRRWLAPAPSNAASDSGMRSIAVMPFVGAGGDSAYRYFADGITDELGTALGHVPGLQVISRRSAFAFEGKSATPQDIGRALRASLLLDGTVRRAGTRVRVNAQLTNAPDATVLWTDHYEGDAKDVFALQDSIANAIVGALRLAIGVGTGTHSAGGRTANLEAHDLYLEGKFNAAKHTRGGLTTALDLFRRSSDKDPRYALPLVGTADALGWLADGDEPGARDYYARATAAAMRAIEIAPDLSEAHAALSWIRYGYDWRMAEAAKEGRLAVTLDPGSSFAHTNYSYPLLSLGQADSALAEMRRGVALEPLSAALSANLEWHLLMQHKFAEAIAQHRRTQQLDSSYFFGDSWAAAANRELGRFDESRRLYEEAQVFRGGHPLPGLAVTYARMGDTTRARRILGDLLVRARQGSVNPEGIAEVYSALGARDSAFAWLERAVRNRSNALAWLRFNAVYDPIRSDPRFGALVQRIVADTLPSR